MKICVMPVLVAVAFGSVATKAAYSDDGQQS
jgi:hypothetical protein